MVDLEPQEPFQDISRVEPACEKGVLHNDERCLGYFEESLSRRTVNTQHRGSRATCCCRCPVSPTWKQMWLLSEGGGGGAACLLTVGETEASQTLLLQCKTHLRRCFRAALPTTPTVECPHPSPQAHLTGRVEDESAEHSSVVQPVHEVCLRAFSIPHRPVSG